MRVRASSSWFLAAALAAAFILAWPLLSEPGLLNTRGGGDSPFLLQRLHQLTTAVADGHFPVRWMPDANYGYGYPFYNFYAPLSIYIAALFRFLGFSFVRSLQLAQLVGFLVAAAGMYFLARRWFKNEGAALLAAVAYSATPFHMVNIYVRGDSLAEFWAMAFYPLTILAVDGLFDAIQAGGKRKTAVALFALAYAALILSHNISALIFSPFLLLYILLRWLNNKDTPLTNYKLQITNVALPGLAALLLAIALAAWFFMPALLEKDLAQLGPVTEGYFHFSNHFLGTAQRPLLQTTFFFNYGVAGFEAFRMGLVQTLTIAVGVILLLLTWKQGDGPRPYRRIYILLALLLSTMMLLPLSDWLWQHLPLLSFTQFPWRFLSVQAFAGALAAGALALLPWRKAIVPVTAVLLLVAALANLKTDHLILTDADVTAERLAQYEWFSGNIGTTVSAEYLPHTVQPRLFTGGWLNHGERWDLKALNGELQSADLIQTKTTALSWNILMAGADQVVFPLLYWPGWEASLDGEPILIEAAEGSGLVSLPLPAGEHQVNLALKRTPVRLAAELVSATAVLLVLWLLLAGGSFQQISRRQAAVVGISLILLIVAARIWPRPVLADDDLTWDFEQMAYLSHAPDGILFSNGLILDNYQFSRDILSAEEVLTITTNWSGEPASQAILLQLTTPASERQREPDPPIFAEQTQEVRNGQATFNLTIPPNAPPGLIIPRLRLADGQALTPSGRERGDLYLRPFLLENPSLTTEAANQLDVKALAVQQRDPTTLDIQLAWWTARPLTENYNVALRLTDANGQFLRLADMQPGYGYQPSSLWPAAQWTYDWLALPLPLDDHEMPYLLIAQLIDITNPNQPILTRRLGELWPDGDELVYAPTAPNFALPDGIERETAVLFAESVNLAGYSLKQTAESLQVTLAWQSLASSDRDYTRFIHLMPLNGEGPPLVQDDNMPVNGTHPMTQWQPNEYIEDAVQLNLDGIPAGDYQLVVGFYSALADGTILRLTAVDNEGSPLPHDQFVLPETITIP